MPEPGDLIEALSPKPGRCFRMVQSRQLQADHCYETLAWKGVWRDRTQLVCRGLLSARAEAELWSLRVRARS